MASKDVGTGNGDEPQPKLEAIFTLDGKVLKIVNEALLEYLGPGFKSHIEIAPNARIVPPLPYFNDILYDMQVIGNDSFVVPTSNLKHLEFLSNFPANEALYVEYKEDGTVVYVFLIFGDNETKLSSPYLADGAQSGDVIKCEHSESINSFLEQKNSIEVLVKYFSTFFSLDGDPNIEAFKWKQDGPDQDFKISKEIGATTFYWEFTSLNHKVKVIDNAGGSLSARLNEKTS